jgi:hypothetical protein
MNISTARVSLFDLAQHYHLDAEVWRLANQPKINFTALFTSLKYTATLVNPCQSTFLGFVRVLLKPEVL